MATLRNDSNSFNVGNRPPAVAWTVVKGDSAAFRVTLTNDAGNTIYIPEWTISMKVKRPDTPTDPVTITDDATLIFTNTPSVTGDDGDGQFTVSLTPSESEQLATGDIFDIQLSNSTTGEVWTVAQGSFIAIEDVTD